MRDRGEPTPVNVHTEEKIKRKRKGRIISKVTEPAYKIYSISFF